MILDTCAPQMNEAQNNLLSMWKSNHDTGRRQGHMSIVSIVVYQGSRNTILEIWRIMITKIQPISLQNLREVLGNKIHDKYEQKTQKSKSSAVNMKRSLSLLSESQSKLIHICMFFKVVVIE